MEIRGIESDEVYCGGKDLLNRGLNKDRMVGHRRMPELPVLGFSGARCVRAGKKQSGYRAETRNGFR